MASARGSLPLQSLNNGQINSRSNAFNVQTPIKTGPLKPPGPTATANQIAQQQDQKKKKKKEKLSSLCKTPPSIVRTRTGIGYHRGLFLGEGGFARCFQMKDESGKLFAAKTVAKASIKSEKTKTKLLSEIKIHKSMVHPNIVRFIDCFEDDVNVYILLEMCPNQSLMELLKTRKALTEPEVRFIMVQIIGAVKYLHSRRVIHRDLKLGNIFFDPDMNLKIGDFGLASVLPSKGSRKYTICGTPNYIAPEVLGGKAVGHSFEVDVWAIGIMMYALLFGKPPFQSKDVQVIYEKIKKNDYIFNPTKDVSYQAKVLIKDILATNPLERPSLDEILEYSWFRNGSFPSSFTVESLTQTPRNVMDISKEESAKNLAAAKAKAGFNEWHRNPVQILKSDLESERPKALLPTSLSPSNVKQKYEEVSPVIASRETRPKNKIEQVSKIINNHPILLEKLNHNITSTLESMQTIQEYIRSGNSVKQFIDIDHERPVLVSKWVDYSNKHGFSYQLSTNDIGVLFNNGSTVLKISDEESLWHIIIDNSYGWTAHRYLAHDIPTRLKKEIEVVDFFSKYMKANLCEVSEHSGKNVNDDVFLRRYTREDHCIMFELSNGSFQFNFKDHHKLCLSSNGLVITHLSPHRTIETYPLAQVLEKGDFPGASDPMFAVKWEYMIASLRNKLEM
ncbi:hypothetical protein LJB42_003052 [Komagataella kurtzmanii]|nr:hypothetical protein LJB42_003052 [Komagataella kurtzmanii]